VEVSPVSGNPLVELTSEAGDGRALPVEGQIVNSLFLEPYGLLQHSALPLECEDTPKQCHT
jgi:hypothetical protein